MKSTTLSTTSERLNLNNPTQGTQCGVMNSPRFSVPKGRDIEAGKQKEFSIYYFEEANSRYPLTASVRCIK